MSAGPTASRVEQQEAAALAAAAEASRDIEHANNYVLAVVLFSAALFFGGISTRLQSPRPRAVLLGLGCAVLVGTLAWVATFPGQYLDRGLGGRWPFMDESTSTGVGGAAAPQPPGLTAEPRWPMATAVLAATILDVGMPHRGRVPGWWVFPLLQLVLLGLLIAQDRGRIDRRSATLHRLMVALLVVMTSGTVLGVAVLAYDIPRRRRGDYRDHPARSGRRHLGRQRDHLQPVVLAD